MSRFRTADLATSIARRGKGAFPAGVPGVKENLSRSEQTAVTESTSVDPSFLRSEWYFARETTEWLAKQIDTSLLAIGAPTVASAVRSRNIANIVDLVDSSPWAVERIPHLKEIISPVDFANFDSERLYETVFLDPPWYFPQMIEWVRHSATFCKPGGEVWLPLFGAQTRPNAVKERETILEVSKEIGEITLLPESLLYDTPYFEQQALEAAGVPILDSWRVTDLLKVRVMNTSAKGKISAAPLDWVEFRIGKRIIGIRRDILENLQGQKESGPVFDEVPGVNKRVMDTVRRRDPRWSKVHVWFSNHRVARIRRLDCLLATLHKMGAETTSLQFNKLPQENCDQGVLDELKEWLDA